MLAFLKRRWILLSCVLILLVMSCLNAQVSPETDDARVTPDGIMDVWYPGMITRRFGLADGVFFYSKTRESDSDMMVHGTGAILYYDPPKPRTDKFRSGVQRPKFGRQPRYVNGIVNGVFGAEQQFGLWIPLWLPLSAVF